MLEVKGQNILLTRGDTAALTLKFIGDNVPDGTKVRFTVKQAATDQRKVIVKNMETSGNKAVLVLDPAETRNLQPGQYAYDVRLEMELTDKTKEILTPMLYGVFQLLENVGV